MRWIKRAFSSKNENIHPLPGPEDGYLAAWAENFKIICRTRHGVRACLKLSGLEHALETHAGHEQRGEHGHVPRGLVAHLVVDAQAAVALQATERLLDLPAPRLDDEALAADRADELPDHAVAGEELAAALGGEAEVHP